MKIQADTDVTSIPLNAKYVRYFDSHLETITRCVMKAKTEYIWILSNTEMYSTFDFDFKPPEWEAKQIHCFASNTEQQGNTFLIPVEEFKKQFELERLEYFKDINYRYPGTLRKNTRTVKYESNLVETVKNQSQDEPYTMYVLDEQNTLYDDIRRAVLEVNPSLWKDRCIYPLNKSGSIALIPREASNIQEELYEYEWISSAMCTTFRDTPQDIVFIDNSETKAEEHYEKLLECTKHLPNKVHRSSGVTGREKAYKAAAALSRTEYFFAVFAKCDVHNTFKFDFQPDHLQQQKHYIFEALNEVNNLQYGHQAIILYNKNLIMNQNNPGLDYTLSDEHTSIPILSCTARYNTSEYETWRTAFRETIKLQHANMNNKNIETEYRLHKWKNEGNGLYGEYSTKGAQHAIEFYEKYDGHYPTLLKTFDWKYLDDLWKTM